MAAKHNKPKPNSERPQVRFYLDPAQLAFLEKAAAAELLDLPAWVRRTILKEAVRVICRDTDTLADQHESA